VTEKPAAPAKVLSSPTVQPPTQVKKLGPSKNKTIAVVSSSSSEPSESSESESVESASSESESSESSSESTPKAPAKSKVQPNQRVNMQSVLSKVKESMEAASTPFDIFMREKVMVDKPYLDKFQHLTNKKVTFRDRSDDYFNLLNQRNKDVILKKCDYKTVTALDQLTATNQRVVFSLTEPDPATYVPVVSPLKLGTLLKIEDGFLEIELREDFVP
jgi:hypothetical protein